MEFKMTTKEAMKQVLAREPNLSLYGCKDDFSWGPYSKRRGEPDAERFRRDREAMLGDRALQEFECACDWLDAQARTKNPNQRIGSSYTLKHMAEKEVETGYLPNGIFIAAAIARGFKIRRPDDGPNVWINISNRARTEFDKREKERVKRFYEAIERESLLSQETGRDEDSAPEQGPRVSIAGHTPEEPSTTLLLRFS